MATPTPGEIAHETYWRTFAGRPSSLPWEQLISDNRAAWEAAAQAVLGLKPSQKMMVPTCRWCGQPRAAHPQEGTTWQCRLSDGPLLPRHADAPQDYPSVL